MKHGASPLGILKSQCLTTHVTKPQIQCAYMFDWHVSHIVSKHVSKASWLGCTTF